MRKKQFLDLIILASDLNGVVDQITANGSVMVANELLNDYATASGYQTPSTLLGDDLVEKLPGTKSV